MPGDERVHEIPLTISLTHMTLEEQQGDYDAVYPLPEGLQDVHFATIEEKKRIWFRDALINTLFIASWCARNHKKFACFPNLSCSIGSSSRLYCPCITNGCSHPSISDFPFHSS
jgi:hypothetical protein